MTDSPLRGVIAAIATAIDATGEPDCAASLALARFLLDNGCDGLDVLGTTGEGTSLSLRQRDRSVANSHLPLSLPGASGLPWRITLIRRLLDAFGERVAGLKDSSGDMDFANEAADLSPHFQVFPATEAALPQARAGRFAGCISATANLNADLCARFYRSDDSTALAQAIAIRKLFDGKPLVPGVKALLAHIHGEPQWARVAPPLSPFAAADRTAVIAGYEAVRAERVHEGAAIRAAEHVGPPRALTSARGAPISRASFTHSVLPVWPIQSPPRRLRDRSHAAP